MYKSNIKVSGKLSIVIKDVDGNIKTKIEVPNLVVSSGIGFILDRMKDAVSSVMGYMAVGSGTSAAIAGDVALGSEITRQALTSTIVAGSTITYSASFGAGIGTGAITEAGILNNVSGGTMLCRTVFAVVNKGASDSMSINWEISLTAA